MQRHPSESTPAWIQQPPPAGSYRSIFKWGAPGEFKHPNARLVGALQNAFGMSDAEFCQPIKAGLELARAGRPVSLSHEVLAELRAICGAENVLTDDYTRVRAGAGKSMFDLFRLRNGEFQNIPDAVLRPRDRNDVKRIIAFCNDRSIAVYAFGGGSSVTRGTECVRGGVSLDLAALMNRILSFNETNQTVTVEPGVTGPQLEMYLNQLRDRGEAGHNYTCGHFPQSFEYSTVGGWVVTRGAGQNSTYYGKIEDIVLSQRYITPVGEIKTGDTPRQAIGPDIDQIMMGSEGAFGILVEVTLKVRRYEPRNTRRFSFLFRSWEAGQTATREILQGEFGFPSVFRLSDPEETDFALKLYGIEGTPIDGLLKLRGYRPGERCLLLGSTDGERDFTRLVRRKIARICRGHGGASTTGYAVRRWEHGRFRDPYMREDLMDFGVVIDTLECAVTWENLERVRTGVRAYCHSRPATICLAHISHFYPQGANLYFIFIAKMDSLAEFADYHCGLLDSILEHGAAMSHHHGVGKMTAPWFKRQMGPDSFAVLTALKQHFDPNGIMNPGGTLAFDLD